jgi:hypothetical protein
MIISIKKRTTLFLKIRAFWDVKPCSLGVDRDLRGTYCLHHQGDESHLCTHLWNVSLLQRDHTGGYNLYTLRRENLEISQNNSWSGKKTIFKFIMLIAIVYLNCSWGLDFWSQRIYYWATDTNGLKSANYCLAVIGNDGIRPFSHWGDANAIRLKKSHTLNSWRSCGDQAIWFSHIKANGFQSVADEMSSEDDGVIMYWYLRRRNVAQRRKR